MTQIIVQNNITSRALAYGSTTLPDFTDVLGEWWPGSGMTGITNRVTGGAGTLIGAPTVSNGYMTVASAGSSTVGAASEKGFLTDVGAQQVPVTIVALMRPKTVVNSGHIFASPSIFSSYGMWLPDLTHLEFYNHGISGTDQPILPIPDNTKFNMFMGYGGQPPNQRLYSTSGGATPATVYDDGTYGAGANLRELGPLQVGGFFHAAFGGSTDIAAIALVDGLKDQAYIESLYARWRAQAIALGLSVS